MRQNNMPIFFFFAVDGSSVALLLSLLGVVFLYLASEVPRLVKKISHRVG